ncbi:hypothetical protein [Microbacterium sp. NPDC086615]|uniref:hypothetical protein n=1 Tax=Microbacterium sp. NPDC086615 TaxID=3154865 RepID=UPI003439A1B5
MTAARLQREALVKQLLQQESSDSFERMRFRFVSAIHSLENIEAGLLLDIYGLSDETRDLETLADRRVVYGNRIRRKPDTVADLEEAAVRRLMEKLLRGTYRQSPVTLDVPDMHNGLICDTISAEFVVEDRLWKRTTERWRFVATFDEADHLDIDRSYPANVRTSPSGAFRVHSERLRSVGPEIITRDKFWHFGTEAEPVPMKRGNPYELLFELTPDDHPVQSRPLLLATRAYHHRSLLSTFSVTFLGETPADVWRIKEVTHFALGRVPGVSVEPSGPGRYEFSMRDTHGGLHNGFGWSWGGA